MDERDTDLERLKRTADLLGMVRSHGVKLSLAGADWLGLCPLHAETTPSFRVTPTKGLWHCFGCGKGGSAVDWLMHSRGLSVGDAIEELRRLSLSAPSPSRPEPPVVSVASPAPVFHPLPLAFPPERAPLLELDPETPVGFWCNRESAEQDLLWAVVEHYHMRLQLSESVDFRNYLEKRGLWDEELLRTFRLGCADRTLGLAIPDKRLRTGTHARELLQLSGVMRESGHEHLNGSLVVPILGEAVGGQWSERGQRRVQGMYGRRVYRVKRPSEPLHLYLRGEMRAVFNAQAAQEAALEAGGTLILCEAILDALTLWRWGFRNVTTAYGVRGVSKDLWRYLTESGFRRVVIAFDADEAGHQAASELAPRLIAEGLEVQRMRLSEGHDVNSWAVYSKDPRQALGEALSYAVWLGERLYSEPVGIPSLAAPLAASPEPVAPATPAPVRVSAPVRAPVVAPPPVPVAPALAAPVSESVQSPVEAFVEEGEALVWRSGDRHWRILGLSRNRSLDTLRLNLRVIRGEHFHLDTLDLYLSKARELFVRLASIELGVDSEVVKRDLGRLVVALEDRHRQAVEEACRPAAAVVVEVSEHDRAAALSLLREPAYLLRLLADLEQCGMVGEEANKLLCWLSLTSRLLENPLGLLIQSTSAAGKTSLLDSVLRTIPEEEVIRYSAVSGQSLFYMGNLDLRHKVLCISEEEGARRASYSLKLLQSDGVLSMASTTKDAESGRLVTKEYKTEGPVALAMTTTNPDVDPELQNRCLVLTVDESREQTEAIHRRQRESLTRDGMVSRRETAFRLDLWRNAQRLLQPLDVVNPYAKELTFASHQTRTRRDQVKYLSLVSAVALVHQHQKPICEDGHGRFIEVDLDDIELATFLATHALGRSLDDLPPQTARLWRVLCAEVRQAAERENCDPDLFRFTRRWVRERTHWGDTQLKVHLRRLEELELVAVVRGVQGNCYRLSCLEEAAPGLVVSGLPSVAVLRSKHPDHKYDATWAEFLGRWSESEATRSGAGRSEVRPVDAVAVSAGKSDGMGDSEPSAPGNTTAFRGVVGVVGNAYREEKNPTDSDVPYLSHANGTKMEVAA